MPLLIARKLGREDQAARSLRILWFMGHIPMEDIQEHPCSRRMAAYIWIMESMHASGVRDEEMMTSVADLFRIVYLEAYKKRTSKMCVGGIRP